MKRIFAAVASVILVLTGCSLPDADKYMGRSQPLVAPVEPTQDIDCGLIFP